MDFNTANVILEQFGRVQEVLGIENTDWFMNIEDETAMAGLFIINKDFKMNGHKYRSINAALKKIKKYIGKDFINLSIGPKGVFFCIEDKD